MTKGGGIFGADEEMTRRQRWVVGGVTALLLLAALTMILISLRRPPVAEHLPTPPDPTAVGDSLVGPVVYTVGASSSGEWVFFDFSRGSVVEAPGPGAWDLGFQRFHIVANGGGGFAGSGGLLDLGAVAFDSVTLVPEAGYIVSEAGRDTTNAATEDWYDYSFTSHLLTPRSRTYAVRTADGRYAKLEVVGYYCPGARPGCLTFRYTYQGDGTRRVGDAGEGASSSPGSGLPSGFGSPESLNPRSDAP